jgi:hypothetical protein
MKIALIGIAAMLPIGSLAPQQAPLPSEMSMTSRAVAYYNMSKTMLTRLAEKMPAEHYGFQPTPEMRTFAANIGHIASANVNQCGTLLGTKHPLSGQDLSKTLTTKADAVKALADTFAFCDQYFTKLKDDAALTGEYFSTVVMREGQKAPIKVAHGGIVTSFIAHNNEVYGYMAVYLRLKGIVPPSSEPAPVRGGGSGQE